MKRKSTNAGHNEIAWQRNRKVKGCQQNTPGDRGGGNPKQLTLQKKKGIILYQTGKCQEHVQHHKRGHRERTRENLKKGKRCRESAISAQRVSQSLQTTQMYGKKKDPSKKNQKTQKELVRGGKKEKGKLFLRVITQRWQTHTSQKMDKIFQKKRLSGREVCKAGQADGGGRERNKKITRPAPLGTAQGRYGCKKGGGGQVEPRRKRKKSRRTNSVSKVQYYTKEMA